MMAGEAGGVYSVARFSSVASAVSLDQHLTGMARSLFQKFRCTLVTEMNIY